MTIKPPTEEQRDQYKAAYKVYVMASKALHACRQTWLPDHPSAEDARVDSQYVINVRIQQQLIDEVLEAL